MRTTRINTEERSRRVPPAAFLLLAACAAWGQEHVVVTGQTSGQPGQSSPYYLYAPHALTQSSQVNIPGTSILTPGTPVGRRGTPVMTVKQGGVTYVLIRSLYRLEIYTVNPASLLDLIPQKAYEMDYTTRPNYENKGTLLSADQKTLYLGVGPPTVKGTFESIWKVDISNLPNIAWAPTLVADLKRSSGAFAECYAFDLKGTQLVAACLDGELFKVDLTSGVPTNNTNQAALLDYQYGGFRIEPTQGNFAYLTGAQTAPFDLLALDLNNNFALTKIATPNGGSRVGGVHFHPSGKWAYVTPPGSFGANTFNGGIGLLTSGTGGTIQPATVITSALPGGFGVNRAAYTGSVSNTKFYLSTLANVDYRFHVMDIHPVTGELTQQPLVTSAVGLWEMALFELDSIPITVDTNLPTAHSTLPSSTPVNLANQVDASIVQGIYNPTTPAMVSGSITAGGSQASVAVSKASVPIGTTEKFDLVEWRVNSVPDTPPLLNPRPLTVQPAPGTNYRAMYDRYAFIEVINNGCATPSFGTGWYKNGIPAVATGTPSPGWRVRDIGIDLPYVAIPAPAPVINGTDIAQYLGGAIPPGTKITFTCELDVVKVTVQARRDDGTVLIVPITVSLKNNPPWTGSAIATYSSTQVPNGQSVTVESTPVTVPLIAGSRWRFIHWLKNGMKILGTDLSSTSTATIASHTTVPVNNNDIFTAVYRDEVEIKTVTDGGCTVTSPVSGWYASTVYHPIVIAPSSPKHTATLSVPTGSFTWNLANPLPPVGDITLNVTCGIVTITHTTDPANIGASVSLSRPTGLPNIGFGVTKPNLVTMDSSAASGVFALSSDTGRLAGNTYYQRTSITAQSPSGPVVANPNSVPVPAVDTTYYSNYVPAGYTLSFSHTAACYLAPGMTPAPLLGSPLVYATGTVVTLTGTSTAGLPVTFQITTGGTTTTSTANPLKLAITGPTTVTPVCSGTPKIAFTPSPGVIRDSTVTPNQWVLTVNIANQGTAPVTGVTAAAKLSGVNPVIATPVALGTLNASGTKSVQFRFNVGGSLVSGATLPLQITVAGSPIGANSTTFIKLP